MGNTEPVGVPLKQWELSSVLWVDSRGGMGGVGGGREAQEGGDICTHIAESLHCRAEINTTL